MITNLILICIIIVLCVRLRTHTLYSKQLFKRAWSLELRLMNIYDRCPRDVQLEISRTLDGILPL
jgi:hypothetical protein